MPGTPDIPEIRLEMWSRPNLLAPVRAMVGAFARRAGFGEIECGQISLAVDEAICNIIRHGYDSRDDGRIWISCRALEDPGGLCIELEDEARQIDPAAIRGRDLDDIRPGGLGVFIIREIMDHVVYEQRDGGGMLLRLEKRLPVPSEHEASA